MICLLSMMLIVCVYHFRAGKLAKGLLEVVPLQEAGILVGVLSLYMLPIPILPIQPEFQMAQLVVLARSFLIVHLKHHESLDQCEY